MVTSLRMPSLSWARKPLYGLGSPHAIPSLTERVHFMRLGLNVGYWGLGLSNEDQLELVVAAEELGYDSVWTAEAYGSDAATVLGWLAGKTSKIKLGSAI